jgi:hypothetical protein
MVAAAASYIDMFKLSLREIRKRFTKSEMAISAWRAEEQYVDMHKRLKKNDVPSPPLKLQVDIAQAASNSQEAIAHPSSLDELGSMNSKEAVAYMAQAGLMPGIEF